MSGPDEPRGFAQTLRGLVNDAASLAQLDAMLLKVELATTAARFVRAIICGVVALVVAIFGLAYLSHAAFDALVAWGMRPMYASLTLAAVFFAVAAVLVLMASNILKTWTLVPRRTIAQFHSNIDALKSSVADARSNL